MARRRRKTSLDITLTYDYDNRLAGVSGGAACAYVYDGDGKLVKMTVGATTTALVGKHFEITGNITKTYYYAGSTRVAVREGSTYFFLLADHLGSTAVTATSAGANQAELRYRAYGLTRLKSGTQKTAYRYTGQRIEGGTDLYYYGARWYDPVVGRFLQADTIVPNPGNPQGLNRYTYVSNNPLRYTDPTGHAAAESSGMAGDPDPYELMVWLAAQANYCAATPEIVVMNPTISAGGPMGAAVAGYMFFEIVHDNAPWDFKNKIKLKLGQQVRIGGHWMDYSAAGNILFGFSAAAAGFSEPTAHVGAGLAQSWDAARKEHPDSEWGSPGYLMDTAGDFYAVQFGYILYQNAYRADGRVTASEVAAQLGNYQNLEAMEVTTPANPRPRGDWPYAVGYFDSTDALPPRSGMFPSFQAGRGPTRMRGGRY